MFLLTFYFYSVFYFFRPVLQRMKANGTDCYLSTIFLFDNELHEFYELLFISRIDIYFTNYSVLCGNGYVQPIRAIR